MPAEKTKSKNNEIATNLVNAKSRIESNLSNELKQQKDVYWIKAGFKRCICPISLHEEYHGQVGVAWLALWNVN